MVVSDPQHTPLDSLWHPLPDPPKDVKTIVDPINYKLPDHVISFSSIFKTLIAIALNHEAIKHKTKNNHLKLK